MKTRQRARQITTTLILATALTFTGGCKPPIHGDIMADKPKTPVVLRDAQEEVRTPKRMLDAVPVVTEKKDAEGETKKEKLKHHDMGFKDHKKVVPLEFK